MKSIFTNRLEIKPWTEQDLEDAIQLWGDPKVMALIDVRGALNREQVREKLNVEIARQRDFGVQYWRIVLKDAQDFIGCCGLRPYDVKNKVFEIGFHISRQHWFNGYGKEAALGVIKFAFEEKGIPKLFAGHNPQNTASKVLLEKLGFKYIGDQFYGPTGLMHPSYELTNQKIS